MASKARKHYKFVKEPEEPLTASFEIDGKVFVTDPRNARPSES
jgi:hypothetical protein